MAKQQTSGCTWLIAILLVGGVALAFYCCGGLGNLNRDGNGVPAGSPLIVIGEIGVLRLADGSEMLLAVDVSSFDRMMQLAAAGDDRGLAALALGGKAFLVPSGTKVRVIGRAKLGVTEVRIEGGDMSGRSGFVPTEFVREA